MRRGGDLSPHGQTRQKGLDLPFPVRQSLPGAPVMKMHVALNPINVRTLNMDRVVVAAQDIANLIENFGVCS